MKRSLAFIIISILLAQCSSEPEQTVVNVASDIIPKSQVVWCNNEINKLQVFVDAVEDDIYLPTVIFIIVLFFLFILTIGV